MVREFPLSPLKRIAKKAGAKRVSVSAAKELRIAFLEKAEKIAANAVAVSRHAGRITVKASDIELVTK
jgi:histone H3/H4